MPEPTSLDATAASDVLTKLSRSKFLSLHVQQMSATTVLTFTQTSGEAKLPKEYRQLIARLAQVATDTGRARFVFRETPLGMTVEVRSGVPFSVTSYGDVNQFSLFQAAAL